MKESKYKEFKEEITNTFLKTVSAFSNYDGGEIIFGVNDNGQIVGIDNVEDTCLKIENKINELIKPNPNFTLNPDYKKKIIVLKVETGYFKPYFYNSKVYKRNDTATIEVDNFELKRLVLEGENKNFEDLKSNNQKLSFDYLKNKLYNILS